MFNKTELRYNKVMKNKSDGCTGFFQTWIRWKTWYSWELFDLRPLCVKHDNVEGKGCASHIFAKALLANRVVGGVGIFSIASIACWVKYFNEQIGKV